MKKAAASDLYTSEPKTNQSIRKKIYIPMITLTIVCCIAVLISSILLFNREFSSAILDKINVAEMVTRREIHNLTERASIAAELISSSPELREALVQNNREKIIASANKYRTMAQIDFCTIINSEGIVQARTHEQDNYGDNLSGLSHVRPALDGKTETYIVPGVTIRLGVMAGAPLYDNNENIIGAVSLGFRLDNQELAYHLKNLTGCEITFFLYDERVSSTVTYDNGDYVLGTKADESISSKVLVGERYIGNIKLFGKNVLANYSPLYGANEQIIGMLFIGYYTTEDTNKTLVFILYGALITLFVLVICVILARFISGIVIARINEANERISLMLDTSPLCAQIWNKNISTIDCNEAGVRLYGFKDKQEYINKFLKSCSPEYQPDGQRSDARIVESVNKAFKEGYHSFEWMHKLPYDDTPLPAEIILVRAKYSGDDVVIGYTRDLREQKKHLEEIEKAREAAEISNQAKSAFLANMSHEIRTPMNSIIGFSELALDDNIQQRTREYLVNILNSSQWLLQIINDILDISKIESGKMELENIPFDLHDMFTHCKTVIMPKAMEKDLIVHFYAEPSTGKRLYGDPTKLRQIFVNLLSNAVKFTNTGIIKMKATVKEMKENSVTICFEIKDSGIGIAKDQLENIFDHFTQAESGTTRKFGGSGLGLPISKNIIEMMGGKLNVDSTPDVGTKFSFELTFNASDIDDSQDISKRNIFEDMKKPIFEGEVLLCEDNIMNQQVICEHLTRVGLKTAVALNGKSGVEMVKNRIYEGKKQFDLIFMDTHMPVMDGLEAASYIIKLNTGVPIIAMTANIMTNDRDVYSSIGMKDCIGKPFTSKELWQCLMKYLIPVAWQEDKTDKYEQDEKELQQLLINNFIGSNRNKYDEINNTINKGDIKLAYRLAHTLKSNAGQLKKTFLQQAAREVENSLKDGKNNTFPEQMKTLKTELDAVIAELEPLVTDNDLLFLEQLP